MEQRLVKRLGIYAAVVAGMIAVSYVAVTVLFPPRAASPAKEPEKTIGELYRVDGIAVNPAGTRGSRLLKVDAVFEAPESEVVRELAERDSQVRDILITELSAHPLNELLEPEGKEQVRRRILERVNERLVHGALSSLYFTQFVVQ
jgi:flagellar FliL protein